MVSSHYLKWHQLLTVILPSSVFRQGQEVLIFFLGGGSARDSQSSNQSYIFIDLILCKMCQSSVTSEKERVENSLKTGD